MAFHHGPKLGGTNLTHYWDAGLIGSYPHSGGDWYDIVDTDITGSVTASNWERRKSFNLSDSNFKLNGNPFNFTLSDEKTFNFFFTPHTSGSYLFNLRNIFRIWLCENKQVTVMLHQTNDQMNGVDLLANEDGLWYYKGITNNMIENANYDLDFNMKDTRFWTYQQNSQNYVQAINYLWDDPELVVRSIYNGFSIHTQSDFPEYIPAWEIHTGIGPTWVRGIHGDTQYIYLTDDSNNRVSKYERDGTLVLHETTNAATPAQCLIDDDWFYVNDEASDTIQKRYKTDLTITQSISVSGKQPHAMAQDDDYIYSISRDAGDIWKVDKDTWTITSQSDVLSNKTEGCAVSGGLLYVLDFGSTGTGRLAVFDSGDLSYVKEYPMYDSGYSFYDRERWFYGVKCLVQSSSDGNDYFYPFGRENRTAKLSITEGGNFGLKFDNVNVPATDAHDSYGACQDGTYAYLANYTNHRVNKYLMPNFTTVVDTFGSLGTGTDNLNSPRGVAVSGSLLFVSDQNNKRIKILNKDTMTYVTQSTALGTDTDFLPYSLALSGSSLFVGTNQGIVEVEATEDLTYIGKTNSQTQYLVTVDDDYIYGGTSTTLRKYDKSDYSFMAQNALKLDSTTGNYYAEHPDYRRGSISNIYSVGDYLYSCDQYCWSVFDKENLGWVNELYQWTNSVSTKTKVSIDEFTNFTITTGDDLILKVYLNGEFAGQKEYLSNADYNTAVEAISGIFEMRNLTYNMNVDWHAIMIHDSRMTEEQIAQTNEGMRERFAR